MENLDSKILEVDILRMGQLNDMFLTYMDKSAADPEPQRYVWNSMENHMHHELISMMLMEIFNGNPLAVHSGAPDYIRIGFNIPQEYSGNEWNSHSMKGEEEASIIATLKQAGVTVSEKDAHGYYQLTPKQREIKKAEEITTTISGLPDITDVAGYVWLNTPKDEVLGYAILRIDNRKVVFDGPQYSIESRLTRGFGDREEVEKYQVAEICKSPDADTRQGILISPFETIYGNIVGAIVACKGLTRSNVIPDGGLDIMKIRGNFNADTGKGLFDYDIVW